MLQFYATCVNQKFNSLTKEDCEDIVENSLIEIWERYPDKSMQEQIKLFNTIWPRMASGVCKKSNPRMEWNSAMEFDATNDDDWKQADAWKYLTNVERFEQEVEKLAPRDRELVTLCLQHLPAQTIATRLGYKSVQVVRNRKHAIFSKISKVFGGQVNTCPLFLWVVRLYSYAVMRLCGCTVVRRINGRGH